MVCDDLTLLVIIISDDLAVLVFHDRFTYYLLHTVERLNHAISLYKYINFVKINGLLPSFTYEVERHQRLTNPTN